MSFKDVPHLENWLTGKGFLPRGWTRGAADLRQKMHAELGSEFPHSFNKSLENKDMPGVAAHVKQLQTLYPKQVPKEPKTILEKADAWITKKFKGYF